MAMKRGYLLIVLLLAVGVTAQVNVPYDSVYPSVNTSEGITRFSDFPLDNIHILRLQEAATSLGGNVSQLQLEQARHLQDQEQELQDLKLTMRAFQLSVLNELQQMRGEIRKELSNVTVPSVTGAVEVDTLPSPPPPPVIEQEATTFPTSFIALLGLNVLLLIIVIILIFWLREQYQTHEKKLKGDHIHPAPKQLVEYVKHELEHKTAVAEIRMELAGKGWSPSIIEHAIHAAKE